MDALIIIDMQNAYFKSPNLVKQKARLVSEINSLIAEHSRRGALVLNVKTIHASDKSTWTLNMLQDNQGFLLKGTEETQNVSGLQLEAAIEIIKTRDSAFHETTLLQTLRDNQIQAITLAGVSAHNCIFHTAAAAYAYDFHVTLRTAAIGDEDDGQRQQAFEYLQAEYRQHIL